MLQAGTELEAVPAKEILQIEIDALKNRYEQVRVGVDGSIPDVRVGADDMLGSVFRNVLSNAVEHNAGPASGCIWCKRP